MSTRRTRGTDRTATVAVGLVLVALGLLAWEWRLDLTGRLQDTLELPGIDGIVDSAWWPWAWAAVGVALGLVGLLWLLAHLPRLTQGTSRLAESDPTGRLEVDRSSLASTLAHRWAELAPVTGAHGRSLADAPDVVVLTAHVDVEAEADALVQAAQQVEREVAEAFSDEAVRVRFVLQGPARQRRTRRSTDITVEA